MKVFFCFVKKLPDMKSYDVAIIGAGPGGMMAAIASAVSGAEVVLVEKNRAKGVKLSMTGNRRCNLTNAGEEIDGFVEKFGHGGSFLFSALSRFGVGDTMEFFQRNGLALAVEGRGRVFPESQDASAVINLLCRCLEQSGATVMNSCQVTSVKSGPGGIEHLRTPRGRIYARTYILATGGKACPSTGSDGMGLKWAKSLGHRVVGPWPGLVPLKVSQRWISSLEGISLESCSVTIVGADGRRLENCGEILFTRRGLSGPAVLDMSGEAASMKRDGSVRIILDLMPELDQEELEGNIIDAVSRNPNREMGSLKGILQPDRLWRVLLDVTGAGERTKANQLTRTGRKKLVAGIKALELDMQDTEGFDRAMITRGGIDLDEVAPSTMKSKIVQNLYFAGEILNLDGPCGGYNLQLCWSTGYVAGISSANEALNM